MAYAAADKTLIGETVFQIPGRYPDQLRMNAAWHTESGGLVSGNQMDIPGDHTAGGAHLIVKIIADGHGLLKQKADLPLRIFGIEV